MTAVTGWPAEVVTYAQAGRRFAAGRVLYQQLDADGPALVLKAVAQAVAAHQAVLFTSLTGQPPAGLDPVADAFLLVSLCAATGGHPDRPRSLDLAARQAAESGRQHVSAILTALLDLLTDTATGW